MGIMAIASGPLIRSFVFSIFMLSMLPSCAALPSFEFFQVPGAISLTPVSINDAQSVTGSYTLSDGSVHAFLRNVTGKLTKFDVGAVSTQPMRINASGEIAGTFSDVAGVNQGFVRLPNGTTTRFNLGQSTQVTDMNSSGTVTGIYSATQSSSSQAFFRTKGGIVFPFTVPGSSLAYPESINDAGQITGFYFFNGNYDGGIGGFVRASDGTVTTFVANAGIVPLAINQAGTITGWHAPPTGSFAPFVLQPGGGITHFSVPGVLVTGVISINAAGVIAGSYTTTDNANPQAPETATHGFLRTPQGAVESFDAPGSTDTTFTAINTANVASGYSQGIAGPEGFLLTPGGVFAP
jgi:hypothetical protein